MTHDPSRDDAVEGPNIDRRTVLRNVGAAGTAALVGAGMAAGKNGNPPGGNPQEECDCPDGMAKYEFEDCSFEHVEGGDWVTITDWESKEGEECEPIEVEYTVDPSIDLVGKVCAFGGTDNVVDDDPDGTFDERLTNPGGQRAAISNITFCVETGFQVDLIYGEPIENLQPGNTYNHPDDRLLQALWSTDGGTEIDPFTNDPDEHFNPEEDAYGHCDTESDDLEIFQEITYDPTAGEATAILDPGECDCEDFALVSYETAGHEFSFNQRLHDTDTSGSTNSDGNCVFAVDVP